MPDLARETLLHQLDESGLLQRLAADARLLFGKRLVFITDTDEDKHLRQPLRVGAVELGWLSLTRSSDAERNEALDRWLGMACRDLAEQLRVIRPSQHKAMPPAVALATQLIRDKFGHALSLAEVAHEVGLSREGLSRAFHSNLGVTFSCYLNQIRLDEARRMLAAGPQAVASIARQCGYQSLSQFNRRFRAAVGMSPGQFRRQQGKVGMAGN